MIDLALMLPDGHGAGRAAPPNDAVARGLRLPTAVESFLEQWTYGISTALFNAVCCSRRAGKTAAAVLRAILVLARVNTCIHYVNLVRRNARKQFWRPLLSRLRKLGWQEGLDFTANEGDMILRTAWGSVLQAMSCDSTAGTKAVQGDRSDLFMVDECHLPNDDVLELLIEVATPMLTDTGGQLDLLGLPPEAEPTYFSDALDNDGWAHFHWTQFDHDFPRPREEKWASVKDSCQRRRLAIDVVEATNDNGKLELHLGPGTHPIVARQYFGKRVRDPSKVAYEYQRGRNDYDPALVDFAKGTWRTSWGLDLGFSDHDALVIGSSRYDDPERKILVRWFWQRRHLDVFDLADLLRAVREVLRPSTATGDHGGHGATKAMKSFERVLGLTIQGKPTDVMVSVGFVNDDLRAARLLLPTQDIYTPLIAAAARRIFATEPRRLVVVLAMLGVDKDTTAAMARRLFAGPEDTERLASVLELLEVDPVDLGEELGQVVKSVNPRTKKVEINKKGKHSDLSEGVRYMHADMQQAPSRPEALDPRRPTDPQAAAAYDREMAWRKEHAERMRKAARPF
jgi:hypothetical protein